MEQLKLIHVFGIEHGPGNTTLVKSFVGFNEYLLRKEAQKFIDKVDQYNNLKPRQYKNCDPLSDEYLYTDEFIEWENNHPISKLYRFCDSFIIVDNKPFYCNYDDGFNSKLLQENETLSSRLANIQNLFTWNNNRTADLMSFINNKGFSLKDIDNFVEDRKTTNK